MSVLFGSEEALCAAVHEDMLYNFITHHIAGSSGKKTDMVEQPAFKMASFTTQLQTAFLTFRTLKTNNNVLGVLCRIMKMHLHAQSESELHQHFKSANPTARAAENGSE